MSFIKKDIQDLDPENLYTDQFNTDRKLLYLVNPEV